LGGPSSDFRAEHPGAAGAEHAAPSVHHHRRAGPWRRLFRRRRFIVDVRLQGGLLADFLLQLFAFSLALLVVVFLPPILEINREDGDPDRLVEAAQQMLALDARLLPALCVAFGLAALLAVRTSHKIAGPLYRFRRVHEALLRREDPGPVRLRKGDYLQAEAASLDRVVRSVVEDRARLERLEKTLRQALARFEAERGPGAIDVRRLHSMMGDRGEEGDEE
jgi:hypothetical protein